MECAIVVEHPQQLVRAGRPDRFGCLAGQPAGRDEQERTTHSAARRAATTSSCSWSVSPTNSGRSRIVSDGELAP